MVNKLSLRDAIKQWHESTPEIGQMMQEIKDIAKGRSGTLFLAAKTFQQKDHEKAAALFTEACDAEEKWIKSDEAGEFKVDKIDRSWTQAKSNVKAALLKGMDLGKYKNESQLRKDLGKVRNGKKGVKKGKETVTLTFDNELQKAVGEYLLKIHKIQEAFDSKRALDVIEKGSKVADKVLKDLLPEKPQAPKKGAEVEKEAEAA